MKQTAVEWFWLNLTDDLIGDLPPNKILEIHKLIEQATAMEKEHLEQFYNQGYTQCSIEDLEPKSRERFVDAKDYYNKTFKSE